MLSEIDTVPVYKLRPPERCSAFSTGRHCPFLAVPSLDGDLIMDDGQPHLAFACTIHPVAHYVDVSCLEPFAYHWSTVKDGRQIWHRSVLEQRDRDIWGRTVNYRASRIAMDHILQLHHVANGDPIRNNDPHRPDRLFDVDGNRIPPPGPDELVCALCESDGHRLLDFADEAGRWAATITEARTELRKAQQRMWDYQNEIDDAWRWLRTHRAEVHEARQFERRIG